jgi:hypothetical protein
MARAPVAALSDRKRLFVSIVGSRSGIVSALSATAGKEEVAAQIGVDAHRVHWTLEVELQDEEPL